MWLQTDNADRFYYTALSRDKCRLSVKSKLSVSNLKYVKILVIIYDFFLAATLGGFYGLSLGASMLSWCEIMEYCVRKIYHKMVSTDRRSIN